MKINKSIALIALAAASFAAQADGITFNTPVTYTQSVTYAAGVTYLAPVTFSESAKAPALVQATAEPVMLERVIVTPSRSYAESEWHALRLASNEPKRRRAEATRYLHVHSETAPRQDSHVARVLRLLIQ